MRKRIVGLTVFAAALAICLFGIPLAAFAAHYYLTDERSELERIADTSALVVSADLNKAANVGALPHGGGVQITVYTSSSVRVGGVGPVPAPDLVRRALAGAVASGNVANRVAVAVPVSDGDTVTGAVLVTASRGQVYWRIAKSWLAMVGLAAVAVVVAWLVARRQARRLAAPLEQIGRAAERLGAGDFSARSEPAGITELDSVSDSLNRTASRLGSLVERERAFSTDASHQLRTPITGLRLGLESALDSPDADCRAAIVEALAATDRLQSTVTDLLALARGGPNTSGPLDVDELIRHAQQRWNGPLAADGRPLRVVVTRPLPHTMTSLEAATQILDVLLDNAYRHGRGVVTVTVRDAEDAIAVDVADEGPALTGDPQELFRRTCGGGNGIGLALARRLAEAEGGRLNPYCDPPGSFHAASSEQPVDRAASATGSTSCVHRRGVRSAR